MPQMKLAIRFNHLPKAQSNLPRVMQRIMQDTANDVVTMAQDRARVRSGRMRSTIRVFRVTSTSATIRTGTPEIYWSIFNEYGTIYMSAAPFMTPAAMAARSNLAAGKYTGNLEGELIG